MALTVIKPDWPAPECVKAYSTTRHGGVSAGNFASLNLAYAKGDVDAAVTQNQTILHKNLNLPEAPRWLRQTHSSTIVAAEAVDATTEADASYTLLPNHICVVQTADCLPLLVCDQNGSQVAAIHAGWRGLAAGIIEQTLQQFALPPEQLLIWLGPAISAAHFVVGKEVYDQFITADSNAAQAFQIVNNNQWHADIYLLAKQRLVKQNINAIYGGNFCTFAEAERFYSYRRDGEHCGRMATLIYLAK